MKKMLILILLISSLLGLSGCDAKKLVKIDIVQLPTKLSYYIGQDTKLDLTGGIVQLTTKDKKSTQLPLSSVDKNNKPEFEVTHTIDFNKIGEYIVNVNRNATISTTFTINVVEPPYVDTNPIKIGLYNYDTQHLLTTYSGPFIKDVDVGVFSAFATQDQLLSKGYFQTVWPNYWNKYTQSEKYKIGYQLSFKLKSGETRFERILIPSDVMAQWDYIRIYLYDDVHQPLHTWYSHLLMSQMKENTVMTSIKLTGNTKTSDIDGPIQLTVFTYDGEEDFDPLTLQYRGVSSFTLVVNQK